MRRDRIEPALDLLLGERLSDRGFLGELAGEFEQRQKQKGKLAELDRVQAGLVKLQAKRGRVVDSYVEGAIERDERDKRLAAIDHQIAAAQKALLEFRLPAPPSVEVLGGLFGVFKEFGFLGRDDKRKLLSVLAPEIRIANYKVAGISVVLPRSNIAIRKDTDSLLPRA